MRTPLLLLVLGACSSGLAPSDGSGPTPATDGSADPSTATDTDDDPVTVPVLNHAPEADAGDDLVAFVADEIELDGSGSSDPDGDVISFTWAFLTTPVGSSSFLINETRPDASFYADREGVYVVELAVDDGEAVATDEIEITIAAPNEGPVANAGPDQTVDAGDRVVLNGSASYDPDADPLTYEWTVVGKPAGSAVALDDPTVVLPQFTADLPGTYLVELVVSDGSTTTAPDQVRVTAQDAGSGDCGSCETTADELQRRSRAAVGRARTGELAGSVGLAFLPVVVLLWQRRRGSST